jgi:hypothetical protein
MGILSENGIIHYDKGAIVVADSQRLEFIADSLDS